MLPFAGNGRFATIAILASALGLQNSTVRHLGAPDLTTTVLTLTLTGLAADGALARGQGAKPHRRLGSVGAMLAGAAAGAGILQWSPVAVIAIAAVLVAGVALVFRTGGARAARAASVTRTAPAAGGISAGTATPAGAMSAPAIMTRRKTVTTSLPTARLGWTDMDLTRVGFGAWAIGGGGWAHSWGDQDDTSSVAAIRHAVESGVNWIDTAAVYGLGHSEEIVATALADPPSATAPTSLPRAAWSGIRPSAQRCRAGRATRPA